MFHVEHLNIEDSGLGVWEGNCVTTCGEVLGGGEEGELSAGGDAGAGGVEGGFHVVDGAERDGVELAGGREGFGAGGPDFNVGKVEGANGFAEEGGLFVLGFGQGDMGFGVKEGDGEAREAGSGAQV